MPSRPCPSHACTCVFTIYVAGVGSGKSKDFRARLGWAGIWVCHSTCGSWSKLFHCICQVGANELLGSCGGGQNCMVHSGAKSGYSPSAGPSFSSFSFSLPHLSSVYSACYAPAARPGATRGAGGKESCKGEEDPDPALHINAHV